MTRKIPLTGVENLRDYGDYPAAKGRLRKGYLYRSANHAYATDEDLQAMAALGVRVIVDLRRPNEREKDPSRRWPGFDGRVIENDIGENEADGWQAFMTGSVLTTDSVTSYMRRYYDRAPLVDRHIDLYSRYFDSLAAGEGPILIHCAAGKDRTGILAALTHHIAGVHRDDIIHDYLLTNDPDRFARRAPMFAAMVEEATGQRPDDETMHLVMGVHAEYLDRALQAIVSEHGHVDVYLEKALGVDASKRQRIESVILA